MKQFYLLDIAIHHYEKIPIFLILKKKLKKIEINNQKKS